MVKEVDEAYAYRDAYPGTLLVGERGGLKVDGFDFGNSLNGSGALMCGGTGGIHLDHGRTRLVDCLGASAITVGTTIMLCRGAPGERHGTAERVPIVIIPAGLATDPSVIADEDWLGATVLAAHLGLPIHQASEQSFQQYQQLIQSAGLLRGVSSVISRSEIGAARLQRMISTCAPRWT